MLNAYYELYDINKTKPRKRYEDKREKLGLPVMEIKKKPTKWFFYNKFHPSDKIVIGAIFNLPMLLNKMG